MNESTTEIWDAALAAITEHAPVEAHARALFDAPPIDTSVAAS